MYTHPPALASLDSRLPLILLKLVYDIETNPMPYVCMYNPHPMIPNAFWNNDYVTLIVFPIRYTLGPLDCT